VDCKTFQKALAAGDATQNPPSPEISGHIADCPGCRNLFILLTQRETESMTPAPALIDTIATDLIADLRPVSPMRSARHSAASFAAIFLSATTLGLILFKPLGLFFMNRVQSCLTVAALAVCAGITIGSLNRQTVPGSLHAFAPGRSIAVILIGLGLAFLAVFPLHPVPHFWKTDAVCLAIGLGLAIPAGGALFVVLRRGAIMNPRLAGCTAGLLAGLVGVTVLEIHCPIIDGLHIVSSHIGALAIATLTGALTAKFAESKGHRAASRTSAGLINATRRPSP
jgi:hypothetical protein